MIWFWSLFGTFIVMAFLFMLLISKGVLGYMPPVDDLLNPKNLLASEIISSDHQVIGQYYKENRVIEGDWSSDVCSFRSLSVRDQCLDSN